MLYSKGNRTAGFRNTEKDKLRQDSDTAENTKGIENHIKAAEFFATASKYHYEAARYHEEGNHEKANECALFAIGYSSRAMNYQIQDAKHHASQK
jgi:hypothetical protein